MAPRSPKRPNRDYAPGAFTATNMTLCLCTIVLMLLVFSFSGQSSYISSKDKFMANQTNRTTSFVTSSYLYRNSQQVEELNMDMHEKLIHSSEPSVIIYYAPWCGHCRHFVTKFNEIARSTNYMIASKNRALPPDATKFYRNITFAAVNCVDQKAICQKVGVNLTSHMLIN